MRHIWKICALLSCVLLLVACGGDGDEQPDDQATNVDIAETVESTPPPAADMVVGDIVWTSGTDEETGAPDDDVDTYTTTSPAIVAVIEVENVPAGETFVATWEINGQEIESARMEVRADGSMPHAWLAFRFDRTEDRLYPVGELTVTVTSSSGESVDASIDIIFPE